MSQLTFLYIDTKSDSAEKLAKVPAGTATRFFETYEALKLTGSWYDQVLTCKDLSDFYDFLMDGVGLMSSELIEFLKSSGLSVDEGEVTERWLIESILAKQGVTLPDGVTIADIEKVSWR